MQCFILRDRHLSGEGQTTAQSIQHTHDVTDSDTGPTSVAAASPPLRHNCYTNVQPARRPARCMSSSCVLETGTGCLCRVAGVVEAGVLHKRSSIQSRARRASCSEGSSYRGGRDTEQLPLHKSRSETRKAVRG